MSAAQIPEINQVLKCVWRSHLDCREGCMLGGPDRDMLVAYCIRYRSSDESPNERQYHFVTSGAIERGRIIVCPDCSAIVHSIKKHDEFHKTLILREGE